MIIFQKTREATLDPEDEMAKRNCEHFTIKELKSSFAKMVFHDTRM